MHSIVAWSHCALHLSNIESAPSAVMARSVAFGQGILLKFARTPLKALNSWFEPLIFRNYSPFDVAFRQDCRCLNAQWAAGRCIWTTFISTNLASEGRCVAFGQGRCWQSKLLLKSGFTKLLPSFCSRRSNLPESLPHVNVKVGSPASRRHDAPSLSAISVDGILLDLAKP